MTSFELERRAGGVAVLWFSAPEGPNLLDRNVLAGLPELLGQLEEESPEGLVVASRNPHGFMAGADVRLFAEIGSREECLELIYRAQGLVERFAALPFPKVAAIDGACAGGGLELALACDYRLLSSSGKTALSLPEVQLGLIPGLGGTQRLPRLVGLRTGLELLLTGRRVRPPQALKMGLANALHHREGLVEAAVLAVTRLGSGRDRQDGRRRGPVDGLLDGLLESPPGQRLLLRQAGERLQREARNMPAPSRILATVRKTYGGPLQEGLEVEAQAFADLLFTPASQSLRHLFFVRSRRDTLPDLGQALEVRRIGVLGAGLMGAGIAQVSARPGGYEVVLRDQNPELAARGKREIHRGLSRRLGKGLSEFELAATLERVRIAAGFEEFRGVQLTIEAVPENLELKREVLAAVESATAASHVFATNTSSIPVAQVAAAARRPERVVGMHYFSPVARMPLLEVIRSPQTGEEALATAVAVGKRQGKTVIIVADSPGFYVNRILAPYLNEAVLLLREGTAVEAIDAAMERLGFPVGPFRLLDNVGLDVTASATQVMQPLFDDRGTGIDNWAQNLVREGLLGRKAGKGFYIYDSPPSDVAARLRGRLLGRKQGRSVNDAAVVLVRGTAGGQGKQPANEEEIQARLLHAMVNEAHLCLAQGVIASADDGDAGAVFGVGFPPHLGGPFHYTRQLGAQQLRGRLEELRDRYGERFTPAM